MPRPRRRRPRAVALLLIGLCSVGALFWAGLPSGARDVAEERRSALRERLRLAPVRHGDVSDYRGPGTWVDIFDESWDDPEAAVAAMVARGYRTLYLETANFHSRGPFVYRGKVERFLDAADARGLRTVAWYLPGFRDLEKDYRRSVAAINLVTDEGNRFDSFALDIESSEVSDPDRRSARMLRLSERIRAHAGPAYPLGGIIPSPRGIEFSSGYWPRFPYRELMSIYDVIVPMSYFTWHGSGAERTRWYMEQCFKILRRESGVPTFPTHMIGGIADETTEAETRAYVRTIRAFGGLGGSYYTFPLTKGPHHALIERIPVNLRQDPAMPVGFGVDMALGNVPGVEESHPKEVVYTIGGVRGGRTLRYETFDAQHQEVAIVVNWTKLAQAPAGPADGWSGPQTRWIPDRLLKDRSRNLIAFVASGDFPAWTDWGVRRTDLRKTS